MGSIKHGSNKSIPTWRSIKYAIDSEIKSALIKTQNPITLKQLSNFADFWKEINKGLKDFKSLKIKEAKRITWLNERGLPFIWTNRNDEPVFFTTEHLDPPQLTNFLKTLNPLHLT